MGNRISNPEINLVQNWREANGVSSMNLPASQPDFVPSEASSVGSYSRLVSAGLLNELATQKTHSIRGTSRTRLLQPNA